MSVTVSKPKARKILREAIDLARSDSTLPVEWTSHTRAVFELEEMTWTPAFATILLAKSVEENIDALSLKAKPQTPNPRAYSARGLCHSVIVPAAVEYGFSIRNTGSEPLNNSPFVSAARIEDIENRAKKRTNFTYFYDVAKRANELPAEEAFLALAAFLREALSVAARINSIIVKTNGLTASGVRVAVNDFLRLDADDRPRRLQAFAAACLDLVFDEVKSRRLNDPSRDFPGDVHAVLEESIGMAVEVRGKAVSATAAAAFARKCAAAGIDRAVLFVDAANQEVLDSREIAASSGMENSNITIFEDSISILESALMWTSYEISSAVKILSERVLRRLREIEVSTQTLQEWTRAIAVAQG
ncbi:restriction endonuclease, SacI family [Brevibacterium linens]|uniref:restriction endonuclease, SacI family n=1 Tax=Brevibacterium linens TaxID=1703 RepID=UPI003BF596D5